MRGYLKRIVRVSVEYQFKLNTEFKLSANVNGALLVALAALLAKVEANTLKLITQMVVFQSDKLIFKLEMNWE